MVTFKQLFIDTDFRKVWERYADFVLVTLRSCRLKFSVALVV